MGESVIKLIFGVTIFITTNKSIASEEFDFFLYKEAPEKSKDANNISLHKNAKLIRDSQINEIKTQLEKNAAQFKTIEMSLPKPSTIKSKNKPDQQVSSLSFRSSFSIKETNFRWGGTESGYKYKGYTILMESTNMEHAKKLTDFFISMSKKGWITDLNRSAQTIQDNIALTRSEYRFKKRL